MEGYDTLIQLNQSAHSPIVSQTFLHLWPLKCFLFSFFFSYLVNVLCHLQGLFGFWCFCRKIFPAAQTQNSLLLLWIAGAQLSALLILYWPHVAICFSLSLDECILSFQLGFKLIVEDHVMALYLSSASGLVPSTQSSPNKCLLVVIAHNSLRLTYILLTAYYLRDTLSASHLARTSVLHS